MEDSRYRLYAIPKLNGLNYDEWKVDVEAELISAGLSKHIKPNFKPTKTVKQDAKDVEVPDEDLQRKDAIARQLITGSVDTNQRHIFKGLMEAWKVWEAIKNHYVKPSEILAGDLRERLRCVSFDDPSKIEQSIKQFDDLVAELRIAEPTFTERSHISLMLQTLPFPYQALKRQAHSDELKGVHFSLLAFKTMLRSTAADIEREQRKNQNIHKISHHNRGRGGRGRFGHKSVNV